MDPRRFDALTRALSAATSRRDLFGVAPAAALVGMALSPLRALADTTSDSVGGSTTTTTSTGGTTTTGTGANVVCLPIADTGTVDTSSMRPPFVAEIYDGECSSIGEEALYTLFDVDSATGVTNVPPAAPMARSVTTVKASLDDLIADRHAVVIRAGADDPTIVACGDVGGLLEDDELAVGLRQRNGSGYSGVSYMRGANGSTLVYIFLGLGLSTTETASTAVGSTVITTADVNLRSEALSDAEIIDVIGSGTELEVTGSNSGDWVPVRDPSTGNEGYVSAQFLTLAE